MFTLIRRAARSFCGNGQRPRIRRRSAGEVCSTAALPAEILEARVLLSMQSDEAYAWYIINTMRQDPERFADQLALAKANNFSRIHGYASNDPVWTDFRSMISRADHPEHFDQAIQLMRAQPSLGPLAWDDGLDVLAGQHNDWMATHSYAHSYRPFYNESVPVTNAIITTLSPQTGTVGQPVPDPDEVDQTKLTNGFSHSENISYSTGGLSATGAQFGFTSTAYRQRQAYLDSIGFMLELDSDSLGHLRNLLARDRTADGLGLTATKNKEISNLNTFALDFNHYDSSNHTELSTHSFSKRNPSSHGGGFVSGVAYSDKNNNGYYDVGEGVQVTWESEVITADGLLDNTTIITNAANFGTFNIDATENGNYTIRLYDSTNRLLSEWFVGVDNDNTWLEVEVSEGFGLTSGTTASLVADRYESVSGNTVTNATDLGTASLTNSINQNGVASIHTTTDADWYKFSIAGRAAEAVISADFDNDFGNLDLTLYRVNSDNSLTVVANRATSSDSEAINLDLDPGNYLVKVFGRSGARNYYGLNTHVRSLSYVTVAQSGDDYIVTGENRDIDLRISRNGGNTEFVGGLQLGGQPTRIRRPDGTGVQRVTFAQGRSINNVFVNLGSGHDNVLISDLDIQGYLFYRGNTAGGQDDDLISVSTSTRDISIGGIIADFGDGLATFEIAAYAGYDITVRGPLIATRGQGFEGISDTRFRATDTNSGINILGATLLLSPSGWNMLESGPGAVNLTGGLLALLGNQGGRLVFSRGIVRGFLTVIGGDGADSFEASGLASFACSILFIGAGGADSFKITGTSTSQITAAAGAIVLMGGGQNTVALTHTTIVGYSLFEGSAGPLNVSISNSRFETLTVLGGVSKDIVTLARTTVTGSAYVNCGFNPALDSVTFYDGTTIQGPLTVIAGGSIAFGSLLTTPDTFINGPTTVLAAGESKIFLGGILDGGTGGKVRFSSSAVFIGGAPAPTLRRRNVIFNSSNPPQYIGVDVIQ